MSKYIALFRGINIGGKHILPMKELILLLKNIGARNVNTYIQSGNAVFEYSGKNSKLLSQKISDSVEKKFGFRPAVIILTSNQIADAVKSNPFPEAESKPDKFHIFFTADKPTNPDLKKLNDIKRATEKFELIDKVFYFFAPEGIGRSKLAARIEKSLGIPTTGRNWRTVNKIREMFKEG